MLKQLFFALSLTAVLAACNESPEPTPGPTPPPEIAACPSTVAIRNFAFEPANCRVAPGTTITFRNDDSAIHNAVTEEGAPVPFETPDLDEGESATVTFTTPGAYAYLCTHHPDMTGTITVQ